MWSRARKNDYASFEEVDETQIRVAEALASENLEGERKSHRAICRHQGMMDLIEDLDPEEARPRRSALKLMMDAVQRCGGYVTIDWRRYHPQRALHAALHLQEEMRRYSSKLRETGNPPLEARVGVNTGEFAMRSIATAGGHAYYTGKSHGGSKGYSVASFDSCVRGFLLFRKGRAPVS